MNRNFLLNLLSFLALAVFQLLVMFFAYYTALFLYRHWTGALLHRLSAYVMLLIIFLAVYLTLMWKDLYAHYYHHYLYQAFRVSLKNLLIASLSVIAALFFYLFFVGESEIVGWKLLLFLFYGVLVLMFTHCLQYLWIHDLSKLGYFYKKVLFVGKEHPSFNARSFFQDFGRTKHFCGDTVFDTTVGKWRYRNEEGQICYVNSFEKIVYQHRIGELVLFMGAGLRTVDIEEITSFCCRSDIGYYLVPDLSSLPRSSRWRYLFSYIPVISCYTTSRDNLMAISLKRCFDLTFSLLVLICFLPFGMLIALLIFLEDGGSPLYVSERVGKDGRKIKFYKFRSMRVNAEAEKAQLFEQNERRGGGPLFKLRQDPRVTKIGHFLRRTSLDEMPQFLNVLRGDLSVVGPRPHLVEEVAFYRGKDFLRLECMPGITCLPQIYDRDGLSFEAWIRLDLYYRKNWSLLRDLKISLATVGIIVRGFAPSRG